jgi:cobalt-zinc-cadmium efflux system membrane fusion protein
VTRTLLGSVRVDANRVARVRARFPGIVREVRANLGDPVARGAVLALVEGNESMRTYPVTAPLGGIVTARDTNVGDVTGDAPLFELSDLSSVWVDLNVFGEDIGLLRTGQPVRIASAVGGLEATARIERILPIAVQGSQSTIARVRLANPDGRWRPGLAVSAEVTISESQVPLAVRTRALQPFRDFTVVYARFGDTYEVRMLELGRQDSEFTEVLGGLEPGTTYVIEQAFLVRADVEKSGATHDH